MGWYDGHGAWGWGGWLAMALVMLAFWSILIAAIVVIVKAWRGGEPAAGRGAGTPPAAPGPEDALRVLDERFARGELDADEYTRRRDLLLHR